MRFQRAYAVVLGAWVRYGGLRLRQSSTLQARFRGQEGDKTWEQEEMDGEMAFVYRYVVSDVCEGKYSFSSAFDVITVLCTQAGGC